MCHGIEWEMDRIHDRISQVTNVKSETEMESDGEPAESHEPVADA